MKKPMTKQEAIEILEKESNCRKNVNCGGLVDCHQCPYFYVSPLEDGRNTLTVAIDTVLEILKE